MGGFCSKGKGIGGGREPEDHGCWLETEDLCRTGRMVCTGRVFSFPCSVPRMVT